MKKFFIFILFSKIIGIKQIYQFSSLENKKKVEKDADITNQLIYHSNFKIQKFFEEYYRFQKNRSNCSAVAIANELFSIFRSLKQNEQFIKLEKNKTEELELFIYKIHNSITSLYQSSDLKILSSDDDLEFFLFPNSNLCYFDSMSSLNKLFNAVESVVIITNKIKKELGTINELNSYFQEYKKKFSFLNIKKKPLKNNAKKERRFANLKNNKTLLEKYKKINDNLVIIKEKKFVHTITNMQPYIPGPFLTPAIVLQTPISKNIDKAILVLQNQIDDWKKIKVEAQEIEKDLSDIIQKPTYLYYNELNTLFKSLKTETNKENRLYPTLIEQIKSALFKIKQYPSFVIPVPLKKLFIYCIQKNCKSLTFEKFQKECEVLKKKFEIEILEKNLEFKAKQNEITIQTIQTELNSLQQIQINSRKDQYIMASKQEKTQTENLANNLREYSDLQSQKSQQKKEFSDLKNNLIIKISQKQKELENILKQADIDNENEPKNKEQKTERDENKELNLKILDYYKVNNLQNKEKIIDDLSKKIKEKQELIMEIQNKAEIAYKDLLEI